MGGASEGVMLVTERGKKWQSCGVDAWSVGTGGMEAMTMVKEQRDSVSGGRWGGRERLPWCVRLIFPLLAISSPNARQFR